MKRTTVLLGGGVTYLLNEPPSLPRDRVLPNGRRKVKPQFGEDFPSQNMLVHTDPKLGRGLVRACLPETHRRLREQGNGIPKKEQQKSKMPGRGSLSLWTWGRGLVPTSSKE